MKYIFDFDDLIRELDIKYAEELKSLDVRLELCVRIGTFNHQLKYSISCDKVLPRHILEDIQECFDKVVRIHSENTSKENL